MDKPARHKSKNKKQTDKKKSSKKKHSEAPTCSMFFSDLTRRFKQNKDAENEFSAKNIVQTIIESISNALPVKFSKRPPQKKESRMQIEALQSLAPELMPNDTLNVPHPIMIPEPEVVSGDIEMVTFPEITPLRIFKMPRMPLISSDILKPVASRAVERRTPVLVEDASVNTSSDHDVASEIAKYVATLKRISMIAEEFNQKTAKNLKEIVDSVQEDLLKKLEETRAEQVASVLAAATASIEEHSGHQKEKKEEI